MPSPLEQYTSTGYKKVAGWFLHTSLRVIEEVSKVQLRRNVHGSVCEIGVHHGRSFILLLLLKRGTPSSANDKAIAIDLFDDQKANIDGSGRGNLEMFTQNIMRHADTVEDVEIIQSNSMLVSPERIKQLAPNNIRLFSVDGGHTAEIVTSDIALAEATLSEGGVVIVDDVFDQQWPGVAEGVFTYLRSGKSSLIPFAIVDDKLLLTNSDDMHAALMNHLVMLEPEFVVKPTVSVGQKCLVFTTNSSSLKNRLRKTGMWQSMKDSALGSVVRKMVK